MLYYTLKGSNDKEYTKKDPKVLLLRGTSGRTRTDTGVTPLDFESSASTNSATLAYCSECASISIRMRLPFFAAPA